MFSKGDAAWLRHFKDVLNAKDERIPEVGRYNAGQKILFFALVIFMIGLLATGVVMWREYFFRLLPHLGYPPGLRAARGLRPADDLRDYRAHLRRYLGKRFGQSHDPRYGYPCLGLEAPPRLVP